MPSSIDARFCGDRFGTDVHVLDASVRVFDVEVERLLVEDGSGCVLVLVRPPTDLDHALHEGDNELRMLLGHLGGAGDDGGDVGDLQPPVRTPRRRCTKNKKQRTVWVRRLAYTSL